MTVAKEVVSRVCTYDNETPLYEQGILSLELADHRDFKIFKPTISYPVHALIMTDSINYGKTITEYLNGIFEADREKYPEELGFSCKVVHSGAGANDRHFRLSENHAWFRYKKKKNKILDNKCCRFLA